MNAHAEMSDCFGVKSAELYETKDKTISYRDNLTPRFRVSGSVKCIRRSVAVKKARKCALRAFPTLSRTLMRTLHRHPYSATLNRTAYTEVQGMGCQASPEAGIDPQILRKTPIFA